MPETVWDRPEPVGRAALAPLSRERIVAAAVRLADVDGLDEVSLRKVAAALGAGPMRLYRYVDSKEELLELMVDAVYAEIERSGPAGDWRGVLRDQARRTRTAALRHEWFADLLGGRPHLGPHALAHLETTLAALAGSASPRAAAHAWTAHLIGAVRADVAELRAARTDDDKPSWQATHGPYVVRMLATGRFPALAAFVEESEPADPADTFDAGVEIVLAGLAAGRRR